jgi:hypothetical protein
MNQGQAPKARAAVSARMLAFALACAGPSSHAAPAVDFTAAEVRADQQFTTYAYAHEFGSGVYDFNGRTLQVYGLPFGWTAREPDERGPGLRLRLPVTLGFLDFKPADVISTGLPEGVDSVSFVPGIELAFTAGEHWRLLPYVQAGATVADQSEVDTVLYGAGLRAERSFAADAFAGLYAGEAIYSGVDYNGDLPSDDFVRLRNSVEFRKGTGRSLAGREVEYGIFTVLDAYLDPPTGPATGLDVPEVQLEAGVVLGTRPGWRLWRVPMPRVGLSYRFAGDLSSVRFVLGAPF